MKDYPVEFLEQMKSLLKDDYDAFYTALGEDSVRAFRVNTDKISVEEFLKVDDISSGRVEHTKTGFYLNCDKPGNHPFHHAGMIYVQEPSAMAPAECVDIEPSWKILDMCAAPGGKSTQLKNKLGNEGVLVSNEIIPSRCRVLTGNFERLGLKNAVTTCMDTSRLAETFPNTFDLIMVDAPCSGEGMFRKDDTAINEWSSDNVLKCAERQKEILNNAEKCLKNDGFIIYATCTFSLNENEMVIDWFLKEHPEFKLVPVNQRVQERTADGIRFEGCQTEDIGFCRRFYPHISKGEGQFMAVLKRNGLSRGYDNKPAVTVKKPPSVVYEFLDEVLSDYEQEKVELRGDTPVYFTPNFYIRDGVAFSKGVTIGEIVKNRIQPHHQFFMAMGENFKRKIELDPNGDDIRKYLHGEELDASLENGWAVVTVCGCAVGGAKVVNGRAKNHYPKGLRTLKL